MIKERQSIYGQLKKGEELKRREKLDANVMHDMCSVQSHVSASSKRSGCY
jgi:hypothetical protein